MSDKQKSETQKGDAFNIFSESKGDPKNLFSQEKHAPDEGNIFTRLSHYLFGPKEKPVVAAAVAQGAEKPVPEIKNAPIKHAEPAAAIASGAAKPVSELRNVPIKNMSATEPNPGARALNDDALVGYAKGETPVRDAHGKQVTHGNLWRSNETINPPQFDALNRQLQSSLKRTGVYGGAVDGEFGHGTQRGVMAIQQEFHLRKDGIAGDRTVAALQVKEAEILSALYGKDKHFTRQEKRELNAELTDVLRMEDSLSGEAKRHVGTLLQTLKTVGGLTESDAIVGQTIRQLKQAASQVK